MKKLFCIGALILGVSTLAQAQVHFNSGSARPIKSVSAPRDLERNERPQPRVKARRVLVKCGDGTRHIARVCRRHGGR
jgi:hypothetical protein